MAQLPLFLVDYSCYCAPEELRTDFESSQEAAHRWKACTPEKHAFVAKIFRASGISPTHTAVPAWLQPTMTDEPKTDLLHAQKEAKMVLSQTVGSVLKKTGLSPSSIDILITNCSIYCPTPSMASMIVNEFKLREDIEAYHLGGMGCSMGVVGLSLVRDMLKAHPGKICLFVSTEIITTAFYPGTRREALTANALFRMGGSASILTNNPSWRSRAKYQLQHCLRVHTGQEDRAYSALNWEPDEDGINGMVITKTLPSEAAKVLDKGVRKMTPRIMTWTQYAEAALNYLQVVAAHVSGGRLCAAPGAYQPDYTKCAEHFLLHAGGYAILRGIQKGLRLPAHAMMPSFASLRDFGNTSSASTWYTWSYIESTTGIKKGDRILQVGVGGGMKSGVAFWRALKTFQDIHPCWAHLEGKPLTESDLPRPISNEYKSIFDLPSSRTAQEQAEALAKADAAPRTSTVTPGGACMGGVGGVSAAGVSSSTDAEQTVKLIAAALIADQQAQQAEPQAA